MARAAGAPQPHPSPIAPPPLPPPPPIPPTPSVHTSTSKPTHTHPQLHTATHTTPTHRPPPPCQVSVLAEKSIVRWGEWEALGGVLASAPRVSNSLSSLWLATAVIRGADKSMWMRQQTSSLKSGVAWGEWTNLQGVLTAAPAVISGEDGSVDVLARGVDRRVYLKHRQLTSTGSAWGEWEDLGGTSTVSPAVERNDDGMLRVFIRMPDRAIYMRTQTGAPGAQLGPDGPQEAGATHYGVVSANASGAMWSNWVSLGGNTKAFAC